jgi:hypothetical protein
MRFVFEIPDQLVAGAPSNTATAQSPIDAISGGAAPVSGHQGMLIVAASSAGEAEQHGGGGVVITNGSDTASDGGAAKHEG